MSTCTAICRVIIIVLDGLRPDAIDAFDLPNIRAMALNGASTMSARTVSPSCTWPAMTSLLSGMSPETHGILKDSPHVPRPKTALMPLPALLSRAGYPSAVFMRALPALYRGTGRLIAKGLGFAEARFAGSNAIEVLSVARSTLRAQRRGLIFLHWADADREGHEHGWMSAEYGDAGRRLDEALATFLRSTVVESDPHTLLVVLADHGGGGLTPCDHDGDHVLNWTIPIVLAGGSVTQTSLDDARLLDVPATIAWCLGVPIPANYAGRVITEAFSRSSASAVA